MRPENKTSYDHIEHELRTFDPLETVEPGYDDTHLVEITAWDISRIDTMLETDESLSTFDRQELHEMGANLRLDWLYAEHGGRNLPMPAFAAAVKDAEVFMKQGSTEAYQRHHKHPQAFWGMQTKMLDLRAYAAHRYAEDSQTTLQGTPDGQKLFGFSQDLMRSVLADSIRLMKDMEPYSQEHSTRGQDARGLLYETMLTSYIRLQQYEAQSFDTVFVRSALSREDRPWNQHVYPKRAFDIVIESPAGAELLQVKNYHNEDEYAAPIRKIEDVHFGDTLHELPRYIADFKLLLSNPADPYLQEPLDNAQRRLDEIFGTQLEVQA